MATDIMTEAGSGSKHGRIEGLPDPVPRSDDGNHARGLLRRLTVAVDLVEAPQAQAGNRAARS